MLVDAASFLTPFQTWSNVSSCNNGEVKSTSCFAAVLILIAKLCCPLPRGQTLLYVFDIKPIFRFGMMLLSLKRGLLLFPVLGCHLNIR